MMKMDAKEQERTAQSSLHTAERLQQAIEKVKKDIANTPEGIEIVFLKGILDEWIRKKDNYLWGFISEKLDRDGKVMEPSGFVKFIQGLEHPKSRIKPDRWLLWRLKRIEKRMRKRAVPTYDEWVHYHKLGHDIQELKPTHDLTSFVDEFMDIHARAIRYSHSPVARILLSRSTKEKSKILALENLELVLFIWKVIYARLVEPKDIEAARRLLGTDFIHAVYDKDEALIRRMDSQFQRLGVSYHNFFVEVNRCFPREHELEDISKDIDTTKRSNMYAFMKSLATDRNRHFFIRLLRKAGAHNQADALLKKVGKNSRNVALDYNLAQTVKSVLNRLFSMIIDKEHSAKDEMYKLIYRTEQHNDWAIEDSRKRLDSLLHDRISKLERRASKDLVAFRRVEKEMTELTQETVFAVASGSNIQQTVLDVLAARQANMLRASDIVAIKQARRLYMRMLLGSLKPDDVESRILEIKRKNTAGFVVQAIESIRYVFTQRMQNKQNPEKGIDQAEFEKRNKGIMDYITLLDEQLKPIPSRLLHSGEVLDNLFKEWEDMAKVVDFDMPEIKKKAADIERMLPHVIEETTHEVRQEAQLKAA